MPRTRTNGASAPGACLLPEPPRPLGILAAARLVLGRAIASVTALVGAVFIALALVFLVVAVPLVLRDRALASAGARATAVVVGRRAEPPRANDGRSGDARTYIVQYEYPLEDGRVVAAERAVDADVWNSLETGDRLDVRYDRDDPSRHVIPGASAPVLQILGVLFPALFLTVGALLVRHGMPEIAEPLRLYRTGVAVTARILGAEAVTDRTVNGRHPVRIRYAFRDREGASREGATSTLDGALVETLAPGAGATVLYAADDPRRSVLLAALGVDDAPVRDDAAARG